ncbi:Uncharacterised protein [Vibrio cholerae]|uniref:Uncharacterized protein n=1 Tax=Vibrio cholerae TaxID=666 RepID=A0A655ZK01_VIBCL|nr:Uncharacterised protein [Vibrio cholerae]CSC71903.1 Uncharacterised protein [Vibrio cholerae]
MVHPKYTGFCPYLVWRVHALILPAALHLLIRWWLIAQDECRTIQHPSRFAAYVLSQVRGQKTRVRLQRSCPKLHQSSCLCSALPVFLGYSVYLYTHHKAHTHRVRSAFQL